MSQSNYPLRLQTSLLDEVRRIARVEGASVNQFINVAVAEKLATLRAVSVLRERAERGDPEGAIAILDRLGREPPRPGDEIQGDAARLPARRTPGQR